VSLSIFIPVSVGEIFDKISILELKSKNIDDPIKKSNVEFELSALENVCSEHRLDLNHPLMNELRHINRELWNIEDDIRVAEKHQTFDDNFVNLARRVYQTNDQRFVIKSKINNVFDSGVKEEKSYESY
jgi:hypothetical protein